MRASIERNAAAGFTLVELLMALLLFGMITATGVALLTFSVRAQAAADDQLDALAATRRAAALLGNDLAQAAPRLTRDTAGVIRPVFEGASGGGGDGGLVLAFVRRGWSNLDGAGRPTLQKVEYRLAGQKLERVHYPFLDGAQPAGVSVLLADIRSLRLRYRTEDGSWRDRWDPQQITDLPLAVEMIVDTGGRGPVRQLFLVRAAQP